MVKLNAKQQRFVEEYLIDLNATQAAIRAGYKKSEYTDTNANKLLENTRIREAIEKAIAERSKRTGINQDRVIQELARIAFVNPKKLKVEFAEGKMELNADFTDYLDVQVVDGQKCVVIPISNMKINGICVKDLVSENEV